MSESKNIHSDDTSASKPNGNIANVRIKQEPLSPPNSPSYDGSAAATVAPIVESIEAQLKAALLLRQRSSHSIDHQRIPNTDSGENTIHEKPPSILGVEDPSNLAKFILGATTSGVDSLPTHFESAPTVEPKLSNENELPSNVSNEATSEIFRVKKSKKKHLRHRSPSEEGEILEDDESVPKKKHKSKKEKKSSKKSKKSHKSSSDIPEDSDGKSSSKSKGDSKRKKDQEVQEDSRRHRQATSRSPTERKHRSKSPSRRRSSSSVTKKRSNLSPRRSRRRSPSTERKRSRSKRRSRSPISSSRRSRSPVSSSTRRSASPIRRRRRSPFGVSRDYRRRSRSRDDRLSSRRGSGRPRSPTPEPPRDLRERISGKRARSRSLSPCFDKKHLLAVAKQNVLNMLKQGALPKGIDPEFTKQVVENSRETDLKSLTELCEAISRDEGAAGDEEGPAKTAEVHHPFEVIDKPLPTIRLNIPNARQLPVRSLVEKVVDTSTLRKQFPVSSGNTHRIKELEWVPVKPKESTTTSGEKAVVLAAAPKNEVAIIGAAPVKAAKKVPKPTCEVAPNVASVTPEPTASTSTDGLDLAALMAKRLEAMKQLEVNAMDQMAMKTYHDTHNLIQAWLKSKQEPGQYTGETDVRLLSREELHGPTQAWARQDQFDKAAPVNGGIGMHLLLKMGWAPGQGLGKNKEGQLEPLLPTVKMDKRGLVASTESTLVMPTAHIKKTVPPLPEDLGGKHPVSALMEHCVRRKLGPPDFVPMDAVGPDHRKSFMFKVVVNGLEYIPFQRSANKKAAKATAALAALEGLGLIQSKPVGPMGMRCTEVLHMSIDPTVESVNELNIPPSQVPLPPEPEPAAAQSNKNTPLDIAMPPPPPKAPTSNNRPTTSAPSSAPRNSMPPPPPRKGPVPPRFPPRPNMQRPPRHFNPMNAWGGPPGYCRGPRPYGMW